MKRPPKDLIEKTVKLAQQNISASRFSPGIKAEQRIYKKYFEAVRKIELTTGMDLIDICDQIEREALRRGITPLIPGKDY